MVGGSLLTFNFHTHGTLAADAKGRFKLPVAATLKEVQFSVEGATATTLDFGTAADPDGILNDVTAGQSEAVATFDRDDFNGALYTDTDNIENLFYAEDTVFEWVVTHASGVNMDLAFIFEV